MNDLDRLSGVGDVIRFAVAFRDAVFAVGDNEHVVSAPKRNRDFEGGIGCVLLTAR